MRTYTNSDSTNVDGELFFSSDDLCINIWNLNTTSVVLNVLDLDMIKPVLIENISKLKTTAEFHPVHPNTFLYATSKGVVNVADMRSRAVINQPSMQFTNKYNPKKPLLNNPRF